MRAQQDAKETKEAVVKAQQAAKETKEAVVKAQQAAKETKEAVVKAQQAAKETKEAVVKAQQAALNPESVLMKTEKRSAGMQCQVLWMKMLYSVILRYSQFLNFLPFSSVYINILTNGRELGNRLYLVN